MSIKLNGATNGSVEIDVPAAVGSDLSVTIPATAGDIVVKGTDGSVDLGDVNIDSGGRLLVGTSSAFTGLGQVPKFFLATTNSVEGDIGIGQFASTNYGAHLDLIRSNSGTIGQATGGAIPTNNTIGNIRFIGSDSVTFRQGAGISAIADQLWASDDCPTRLVFSTTADGASSATERMRIDSSGKVRIGASDTSDAVLDIGAGATGNRNAYIDLVGDTTYSDYGLRIIRNNGGANTTSQITHRGTGDFKINTQDASDVVFTFGNTQLARMTRYNFLLGTSWTTPGYGVYQLELDLNSAGKPASSVWAITSDERIKEDIELADIDICYNAIKSIPLKRFKWKDEVYTNEQVHDRHKIGWIAQDVEAVFPKAVRTHEFRYNQVFEEIIIPAVEEELDEDGNVITPAQPERVEKGELISEEVIEDCRDLDTDQLYAAMYGAIQKLIAKVETLEQRLNDAGIA